jgi:Ala-tRNA(Pro) deacylase
MTSSKQEKNWSGRRDSNPRPRPWQGRALPLSYTRIPWDKWPSYAKRFTPLQPAAPQGKKRVFRAVRPRIIGHVNEMPASPDDLFAFLDRLGIAHNSVTHPPLFTVEQSQALRGTIAGGHTKNLFVKDKRDKVFLLVVPEDAVIELKSMHKLLGASGRFSFASAALMQELLGVEPGSVTPFGVINDKDARVTVVLDATMMANGILNYHPLVNTMTTSIASRDLVTFLKATGHDPRIEALSLAQNMAQDAGSGG